MRRSCPSRQTAARLEGLEGLEPEATKQMIEAAFAAVADALASGDGVSIPRFGRFKVAAAPARHGVNLQTREVLRPLPPRTLPCAPSAALLARARGGGEP